MSYNFNASVVGDPYVRAHRISINYPDNDSPPSALIEHSLAVKLVSGIPRKLEDLPSISVSFDFANNGNTPIPLVSPEDRSPILVNGQPVYTTLNQVMLSLLAVVHQQQQASPIYNPPPEP